MVIKFWMLKQNETGNCGKLQCMFLSEEKPSNIRETNPWSGVLLENLRANQLTKKFPQFYELKSILPYSEGAMIGPILSHINLVQLIYFIKTPHTDNP
jgi:hypothetical protein